MADRMAPPGSMASIAPAQPTNSKMPPPGMSKAPEGDGKASPDESGVIRSDAHCIDCKNYDPTSGDCSEVSGSFDPQDGCHEYFDAIGGDEPDDDDMGGASDMDADDTGMDK